jgi:gas vesicle protein
MKHFLIGFAVGAPIGASIVLLVTPISGRDLLGAVASHVSGAIEGGKQAAARHEAMLWEEFRGKLQGPIEETRSEKPDKPEAPEEVVVYEEPGNDDDDRS